MVTLEQWKEFQEHRNKKSQEVWDRYEKDIGPKNKKFLFWEYKSYPDPFYKKVLMKATMFVHEKIVPENTVEACMDWLLSKKEIQNDPQKPK